MGGCSRLRWSAACILSVSSDRLRCAWTLWAVSGRHLAPRQRDWRPRPARLLQSLSPPADRPRVPCTSRLSPAARSSGLLQPLTAASDARETRQNSQRQWQSRLLSPLSPPADLPRVSSAYITVPDDHPAHGLRQTSHLRAHPQSSASRRRHCQRPRNPSELPKAEAV